MAESLFSKLFGGVKRDSSLSKKTANTTIDAIQALSERLEHLEKRKEVLEKKIEAEIEKAKQYLKAGNRSGAQACMKRKALLMKQLENIQINIDRVSESQSQLEDAQTTIITVAALQQGAKAQKANMQEFSVEKVDKVMEEIQETAEQVNEIQQALAMPLGGGIDVDLDEIDAELDELEAKQLDEELLAPAPVPTTVPSAGMALPSVPTSAPVKPAKTTDDELAELERELMAS